MYSALIWEPVDVVESLVGLGYFCGWEPVNVVGSWVRTYHARILQFLYCGTVAVFFNVRRLSVLLRMGLRTCGGLVRGWCGSRMLVCPLARLALSW